MKINNFNSLVNDHNERVASLNDKNLKRRAAGTPFDNASASDELIVMTLFLNELSKMNIDRCDHDEIYIPHYLGGCGRYIAVREDPCGCRPKNPCPPVTPTPPQAASCASVISGVSITENNLGNFIVAWTLTDGVLSEYNIDNGNWIAATTGLDIGRPALGLHTINLRGKCLNGAHGEPVSKALLVQSVTPPTVTTLTAYFDWFDPSTIGTDLTTLNLTKSVQFTPGSDIVLSTSGMGANKTFVLKYPASQGNILSYFNDVFNTGTIEGPNNPNGDQIFLKTQTIGSDKYLKSRPDTGITFNDFQLTTFKQSNGL